MTQLGAMTPTNCSYGRLVDAMARRSSAASLVLLLTRALLCCELWLLAAPPALRGFGLSFINSASVFGWGDDIPSSAERTGVTNPR